MSALPAAFAGLIDDAAVFPPGDAPLDAAVGAFLSRRQEWYAGLVASFVVRDVDLASVATGVPVSAVVTGGAGSIAGVARRPVAAIEIALRDLDDLPGNTRRVVAAVDAVRSEGLPDDVPVYVEIPGGASEHAWSAAADEVAGAGWLGLRLKLRTGGLEAHLFPTAAALAAWIDGALDRETAYKCTAGLHRAVRHTGTDGFEHHGFLNVLLATRRAFDGASRAEVVETLEERDPERLDTDDLVRARRWFVSFGSCSVTEPLDDLLALDLLEAP